MGVAKELLNGQLVVVVRCEKLNISGSLYRNKLKYAEFLKKGCNPNPRKGPFHHRAPSKIFWRTVRGMLPHRKIRGQEALKKLKVFEGCPPPFGKLKKVVAPDALRALRLAPGRRYCVLGQLSAEFGWKYPEVVERLEAKRKVAMKKVIDQAKKEVDLSDDSKAVLEQFGYN